MPAPSSFVDMPQADADSLARASPILLTLHITCAGQIHIQSGFDSSIEIQNDNSIGKLCKSLKVYDPHDSE
jgi:hypothetical protein